MSNLELASGRTPSPRAATQRRVSVVRPPPGRAVVAAFVLFVASIPLEEGLTIGGAEPIYLTRLLGYALLGAALLQARVCFKRPPAAIWWFVSYVAIYTVDGLFQSDVLLSKVAEGTLRFAQLLVLLWIGYSLLQFERLVRLCFWGFGWSAVALASLVSVAGTEITGGRETVFGQGVDSVAAAIALGAVALIGMVYGTDSSRKGARVAAWAGFVACAIGIARTGTRGALVELGVGLLALLLSRGSARTRVRNSAIVVVALLVCYVITILSATAAGRWEATVEEGSTSGRQSIYRSAAGMVAERPVFGWGPVMNYYELGYRLRRPVRDTHNLALRLLTEVGLVGTIPASIGLFLCVRSAWRGRKGTQRLLPLALMSAILVVSVSNTYWESKWFWLVLAYSLASETYPRSGFARYPVPSTTARMVSVSH